VLDWSRYIYMGETKESEYQVETLAEWCPQGSESDPVTCIVDECSEWIDSYFDGMKLVRLMAWFRQSIKLGIDIQLVTQDENLVQRRVRLVCGQIWRHSDGKKFKIPHLGIPLPPPWRWCFASRGFDRTGKIPLTGIYWEARDSRIWACYKTEQIYSRFGGQHVASLQKEGEDMRYGEKCTLYGLCLAIVAVVICQWYLFKQLKVIDVERVTSIIKGVAGAKNIFTNLVDNVVSNVYKPIRQAGSWGSIELGNVRVLMLDGERVVKGGICKFGRAVLVGTDKVLFFDQERRPVMVVKP